MALLEKQLYVKKSGIPGAGKGLFTKKFIPKGTRIVEYKGRRTKWKEVKDEDGKNGYIFYINRNKVIDALPSTKALARYANDARGMVRLKGVLNNSDYIIDGDKVFIEATRDIAAKSEILVDYGREYWQVIRQNIKIDKDAQKKGLNGKSAKHHHATAKRMEHHN
jgi:SET domain-containing protein